MRIETARIAIAIRNPKPTGQVSETLAPALRSGASAGVRNPPWSVLVGLSVMAIYLALLPFVERTWRATGDEPHYLLAAHSLVTDLDFDLANNYDQLDYLAFYFSKDIDRQVRTGRSGQQILNHQLGLPVLIAPAYALAGRFGVLVFQIILGGFLAAITFKLAVMVSRDEKASLLATLFVAFSPPLFMYHYLVYPELMGALLTTLVLYYALRTQSRPAPGAVVLVILALMTLPWLNRRFAPLAILLALFIVWAWRAPKPLPIWGSGARLRTEARRANSRQYWPPLGLSTPAGLLGLIATILSIALLSWFNNQLEQPVRVDIIAPAGVSVVWHRLGRGVGWLVDQQRGLFIFAPIYILALWGLPPLIHNGLKHYNRNWFVVGPFLLSLGVTAAAGGFWVPWELGPRFLVVALPALASLLALAWRHYGRCKIWTGLASLLFGLSLSHSLVIIQNPELPYKSSLPLFYDEKLPVPLTELLPDLAGFARISAVEVDSEINRAVSQAGEPTWFAEAGRPLSVARSEPLYRLPFGHYRLTWPVRVDPGLSPETELMRISVKLSGGGPVFNRVITAAELPGDGSYGMIKHSFINTNIDRWRTPLVFHAVGTGRSNIWGKDIVLAPDPFYAWFLPYLYLALLLAGAFLAWYRFRRFDRWQKNSGVVPLFILSRGIACSLILILPLVAFGNLLYQKNQSSRTYNPGNELYHFIGQSIADPEAKDGQAWLVDPAIDPPQKAMHGPFDIYDPGRYHVTFRMKLPEAIDTDQEIARLQVKATANLDELVTQPIRLGHFSRPDLYHNFVLTITNPVRQALSFEVHYLGVAALAIDEVTITKIDD